MRSPRASLPLSMALAVALALGAVPAEAAGLPEPPARLDVRTPVVEAALTEAHGTFLLRPVLDSPPGLDVLLAFSQPIVRGADDYLAVLWVVPAQGEYWSGVWWADSSAGATLPKKVTVWPEGMFLVLSGGARASGDRAQVTFTFVGEDTHAWTHALAPVPVVERESLPRTVAVGGAAASDHGSDELPEIMVFTVWNLLRRDAEIGFSILDEAGDPLQDETLGLCADGSGNLTEAGCRVPYVAYREGAHIVTWRVGGDGERVEEQRHAVAKIVEKPFVHGAHRLKRDPWQDPLVEARATLVP